eukprot:scaffold4017_cov140-Isochrysis_galbana.AAC.2
MAYISVRISSWIAVDRMDHASVEWIACSLDRVDRTWIAWIAWDRGSFLDRGDRGDWTWIAWIAWIAQIKDLIPTDI